MTDLQTSVYRPDEHFVFVPQVQMEEIVQRMRVYYDQHIAQQVPKRLAFFRAYGEAMREKVRNAPGSELGMRGLQRELRKFIAVVRDYFKSVVKDSFSELEEQLGLHDLVATATNPIKLLLLSTEELPPPEDFLGRRCVYEARRNMIMALQLLAKEMNDAEDHVGEDLHRISALRDSCLFTGGCSVYVLALRMSGEKNSLCSEPFYFTDRDEYESTYADLCDEYGEQNVYRSPTPWPCRLAQVNGYSFVVYQSDSGKRSIDALVKLERLHAEYSRGDRDSIVVFDLCRWTCTVLGTLTDDDGIEPVSDILVQEFHDYTVAKLWSNSLLSLESEGKKISKTGYQVWKTLGRFNREEHNRVVAGPCEQQVQSGYNYLAAKLLPCMAHDHYRGAQLLDSGICKLWWGHLLDFDDPDLIEKIRSAWT